MTGQSSVLRVGLVGLGATGSGILQEVLRRPGLAVRKAIDPAEEKVGLDAGVVAGGSKIGIPVEASLAKMADDSVDVAVVTAGSFLRVVAPIVERLVEFGINVVSLCEELSFPWSSDRNWASAIDKLARAKRVSVLGTGCNPGFVMDVVPIILTACMGDVERITIRRMCDVSKYGSSSAKHGLGLLPEEFASAVAEDSLYGHIGFRESILQLGSALGWNRDGDAPQVQVSRPEAVVIAEKGRSGDWRSLSTGTVAVVKQTARGKFSGNRSVELEEYLGFPEASDGIPWGDHYVVAGSGRNLVVDLPEGFDSYKSSSAILTNMIRPVATAEPGIRVMSDFRIRDVVCGSAKE